MRSRWRFAGACARLGLVVAALAGCDEEQVVSATDDSVGVKVAPVVGGKEVTTCQWPSTVMVNSCTGTLIHPRVVTTAAHCLGGATANITFGGTRNSPGSFSIQGQCKAGARGSSGGGSSRDWGYCVLPDDDRIKALPYTPPLVGCEAERFLKAGAKGWVVGYGTTGPEGRGAGIKREVEVNVNRVSNGTVDVGDAERGACHGDSGGPIYMRLSDGTKDYGYRVFGSTSSAGMARCDCTCSTLYVNISMHVNAIEENEGIDVTPCTDAQGNWAPGPECNALIRTPQTATGTFPSCAVEKTIEPLDSCGMGAGPGPAAGSGGSGGMSAAAGAGGAAAVGGRGAAGFSGAAGGAAAGGGGASAGTGAAGFGAGGFGAAGTAGPAGAGTGTAAVGGGAPDLGPGLAGTGVVTAGAAPVTGVPGSAAGALAPGFGEAGTGIVVTREDEGGCQAVPRSAANEWATVLACAALGSWLASRRRRCAVRVRRR